MIKTIIESPIYKLLFGGGGILIVIFAVIPFIKRKYRTSKREGADNEEMRVNVSSPQTDSNIDNLKEPSEALSTNQVNVDVVVSDNALGKKNAIDFATNLTFSSPSEDKITVKKINLENK